MKKLMLTLITTTLLTGGVVTAFGAGITGTSHDLSAKGWGTTEVCKFCHTPHQAQTGVDLLNAPLWNHQTRPASAYTMYNSSTFQGRATQGNPGPASLLCLSCHDGVLAVDSFANAGVLQSGTHFISTTNRVGFGGNLTSDHPIAFTYDTALAALDTKLYAPASTNWVDGAQKLPLFAGKMECGTCHDSHDNTYGNYLRLANTGSALCLKCHNR